MCHLGQSESVTYPLYNSIKTSLKYPSFLPHLMPPLLFNNCRKKPSIRKERHTDRHRHRDRFPRQLLCQDRFRLTWQTAMSIRRQRKSKVENSNLVCLLFKWEQWEVFFVSIIKWHWCIIGDYGFVIHVFRLTTLTKEEIHGVGCRRMRQTMMLSWYPFP